MRPERPGRTGGVGMDESYFYCMKCRQLASVARAAKLFKTGFFRNEYPLGCCDACAAQVEPLSELREQSRPNDVKFS